MKVPAEILLSSLAVLAANAIPEKHLLPETTGLKKEDPKTKKFNKASAKSRKKNQKIAARKGSSAGGGTRNERKTDFIQRRNGEGNTGRQENADQTGDQTYS